MNWGFILPFLSFHFLIVFIYASTDGLEGHGFYRYTRTSTLAIILYSRVAIEQGNIISTI